jgi:hypothetical protein
LHGCVVNGCLWITALMHGGLVAKLAMELPGDISTHLLRAFF